MWHYIGRNWFRHGMVPYEGGADNKTPLIFIVFGISDWLFGVNYWFPRVAGTVVEAIGIYYIYRIAKQLAGDKAGLFAISIYGLSLLWKMSGGKLVSFTETYATVFVIVSFYKCLVAENNKGYFISGVLAGLGFAFRLTAGFGVLAVFITAVRKDMRGALLFVAGVITTCVVLTGIAWVAGIPIESIVYYTITDNFGAGSTTDHSLSWKLESFISNFFYSELILFYPFVIGYILIKKKTDALVVWLICTFIGISIIGIYARPHFKELLPALSLMAAIALAHLSEAYKVSFKGLMMIVWICFFPKVMEPWWGIKKLVKPSVVSPEAFCSEGTVQVDEQAEKQLGLWIKGNTKETDRVYVAGYGARVQVFSERVSPTVYFNVTQTAKAKERLLKELTENKAAMIAVPVFENYRKYVGEDIRDFIEELVKTDYTAGPCMYGYIIYRLK
jgi:hypothetical protein